MLHVLQITLINWLIDWLYKSIITCIGQNITCTGQILPVMYGLQLKDDDYLVDIKAGKQSIL